MYSLYLMGLLIFILYPSALSGAIYHLKITGPIETVTAEYIGEAFAHAAKASDAQLILLEIDTPGGFSVSMRDIIKTIMDSPVPVAAFVHPKGARAASAGFVITIAADIACMAPGTNMGAAHPVSIGSGKIDETMRTKMTNDAVSYVKSLAKSRNRNIEWAEKAVKDSSSYTAQECLDNNLIDYIAEDIPALLKQLEGKIVTMVNGKSVNLTLTGQPLIPLPMGARRQFLKTITNPNLAYFLLIFGLLGLYLEFTHPGIIIPGVIGGICLLLAFMAFQVLPINYIGLMLIILSIGFFIAEIKIQGFGMFGVGGIIAFVLGSTMLIDAPIAEMRISVSTIIMTAAMFGGVLLFLTIKVLKAMKQRTVTGKEAMIGKIGTARTEINQTSGKVFVHGEWWNAVTYLDQPIPAGTQVSIDSIENFVLKVTPKGG